MAEDLKGVRPRDLLILCRYGAKSRSEADSLRGPAVQHPSLIWLIRSLKPYCSLTTKLLKQEKAFDKVTFDRRLAL